MVGLLSALYALFGVVFIAAYVPQLCTVWRSRDGAASVSLGTWGMWCMSSTVSLLYAHLVLRDLSYSLVCLGNVAGCYAVTALLLWRRRRHRRVAGGAVTA